MALLEAQEQPRIQWLIPERHRPMAASAFAFFRGSLLVMAADLGRAAHSRLEVQLCGDAHLLNFGFYACRERALLFEINDFDGTVQGPFEWGLKHLVSSLVIAARSLHLSAAWQAKLAPIAPGPTARRCRASPIAPAWRFGTGASMWMR